MADDLSVAIDRLRTATHRLNDITDAAAQVVKDVEAFLEGFRVGVEARTLVKTVGGRSMFLEYRRLSTGKFRIAVVKTSQETGPDLELERAWSESSRNDKIECFAKLPELLVELSKRVNEETDKAEEVIVTVARLLKTVNKRKGGQ